MSKGSTNLSFEYNESGLRTQKTVNGTTHTYTYMGNLLVADVTANDALYFHYDSAGDVLGFTYASGGTESTYFYLKNRQGDIVRVLNYEGKLAASYTYDAWGNILSISGPDTNIANRNPLRYKGYYYDAETDYYYLQSRYYDPEIGRFINADGQLNLDDGILGTNMFAYCGNNPVNCIDNDGNAFETVFDVVTLATSAVEVTMNPTDLTAWACLIGDTIDLIPFVTGVGETIKILRFSSKIAEGTSEAIDTYSNLRKITKGTGKEVHHIIEKRFAKSLGIGNSNNMLSVALDKETHRKYTNAWRRTLPYGKIYNSDDILRAAAKVYSDDSRMMGIVIFSMME